LLFYHQVDDEIGAQAWEILTLKRRVQELQDRVSDLENAAYDSLAYLVPR